jgi:hypothetical protein
MTGHTEVIHLTISAHRTSAPPQIRRPLLQALSLDEAGELAGIVVEAGEDRREILHADVSRQNFSDYAEVRCERADFRSSVFKGAGEGAKLDF